MKYKLSPEQSGLTPHRVQVVPYNSQWPILANEAINKIKPILGDNLKILTHIGSTSIPGLAAKPVIDLLGVVFCMNELDKARQGIQALGYQWHGEFGINGRRFCTLGDNNGERLVHLHIFENGSEHITRHIAFRDYILAHPEIAQAYEKEKLRAAKLWPEDSMAYNDEKSGWIKLHEAKACKWYDDNTPPK